MWSGGDGQETIAGSRREDAFADLVETVEGCRACARMEGRTRVLSAANGPIGARVCFVAEAPGRLGGERTKVPLFADQSGRNFGCLLDEAELDRASVFITNAVLCNPQDQRGRNAPPSIREVRTCSPFLVSTLDLVQPAVVVTLGAVALRSLALIEPHALTLTKDCGRVVPWYGRWLVPLYHPSPRAQLSRSFEQQASDFRRLGAVLRGETGELDGLLPRASSASGSASSALPPSGLVPDLRPELDIHATS